MRLLPAAHLHAAPCEEVRLPTGHIVDRLDIVRVARIGGNIGKADHHVVKGQLLSGQLVHGVLIGFFGAVVHFQLVAAAPAVVGQAGPVVSEWVMLMVLAAGAPGRSLEAAVR